PAEHPVPVPASLDGAVQLRELTFTYPETETPAVDGITLSVAPGETVALVGATGAGKSTVVKLIARFYDPTGGAVLVDGADLRAGRQGRGGGRTGRGGGAGGGGGGIWPCGGVRGGAPTEKTAQNHIRRRAPARHRGPRRPDRGARQWENRGGGYARRTARRR